MKKISILLAAAVLSAAACAQKDGVSNAGTNLATNSAAPASSPSFQITPQPVEADRIALADAKKEFDAGTAVFVDVRGAEAFNQERVAGALNIPVSDIEANISKIPKGKKIIVYCSWANEHSSASWVSEAKKKGINNAVALLGGTQAWVNAGYPTEKGQ